MSRIVSVVLLGGLCNRLFQIACCYGYAEKNNLIPVFYKCFFEKNEHTNDTETINILRALLPDIDIRDDIRDDSFKETDFYLIEPCFDFACKYIDLQLSHHTDKHILGISSIK